MEASDGMTMTITNDGVYITLMTAAHAFQLELKRASNCGGQFTSRLGLHPHPPILGHIRLVPDHTSVLLYVIMEDALYHSIYPFSAFFSFTLRSTHPNKWMIWQYHHTPPPIASVYVLVA